MSWDFYGKSRFYHCGGNKSNNNIVTRSYCGVIEIENLEALEAAFAEMNEQSGLKSELISIEQIFPK